MSSKLQIPSFEEAKNRRQKVRAAGMNPNFWYPVEYADPAVGAVRFQLGPEVYEFVDQVVMLFIELPDLLLQMFDRAILVLLRLLQQEAGGGVAFEHPVGHQRPPSGRAPGGRRSRRAKRSS